MRQLRNRQFAQQNPDAVFEIGALKTAALQLAGKTKLCFIFAEKDIRPCFLQQRLLLPVFVLHTFPVENTADIGNGVGRLE